MENVPVEASHLSQSANIAFLVIVYLKYILRQSISLEMHATSFPQLQVYGGPFALFSLHTNIFILIAVLSLASFTSPFTKFQVQKKMSPYSKHKLVLCV
jgi:hypothetical protein